MPKNYEFSHYDHPDSQNYSKEERNIILLGFQRGDIYAVIANNINTQLGKHRSKKSIRGHVERNRDVFGYKAAPPARSSNEAIDSAAVAKEIPVDHQVEHDRVVTRITQRARVTNKKYNELMRQIDKLEKEKEAILQIGSNLTTYQISPKLPSDTSEATAFMVASDWHCAEKVESRSVNGLNMFNLDECKKRSELFFKNGLRLLKIQQKDVHIDTLVLPILGDMISGHIHDELMESNYLSPIDETIYAQNLLASGIEFLCTEKSIKKIIIPCHYGNHGRTTRDRRISTERGNSLEYFMYHQLANHFRKNKKVEFIISGGYHSYLEIYGYTLRMHHGHSIGFGGGVGGISIPVNKAISQWDKIRRADLDIFGHFHQFLDGGKFLSNGSLIGYNAFALSIKASYDVPKQAFFLIDKKRFKTIVAPILMVD